MIMKRIFMVLMAAMLTLSFCSCKKKIDLETGVTYSTYVLEENGKKESYASFYMTSNKETEGVWEYEIKGDDILEIIESNEENKDMKGGVANYKTLIVKAIEQGNADITFTLGDEQFTYSVNSDKTAENVYTIQIIESTDI